MKKMQKIKKPCLSIGKITVILLVLTLMLANMMAQAILPIPDSEEAEQADGTIIIIVARGDENFGWTEDAEGYVIAYDIYSRNWCYALISGNTIIPGPQIVGMADYDYSDRITAVDIAPLIPDSNGIYTVTFETNGGSAVSNQNIIENLKVTKPDNPTKEKFTFAGWYADKELTQEYDFGKAVTSNLTLFAKWLDGAENPAAKITLVLTVGSVAYTVNGNNQTAPIAPVIKNNRTLVPLRLIAEGLGADVSWEHYTKTVTISYEGKTITLKIGQLYPGMDVPAEIIDAYTMVPVRYIAETFEAKVEWDNNTKKVTIIK